MTTAETPQQFLINAIGFSNCGYMNLQQYGNLVQKIAELLSTREKLEQVNQQILEFEEREASCCPEDVGCDEYIPVLQKKLQHTEAELADMRERVRREALEDAAKSCELRAAKWAMEPPNATQASIDINAELRNEAATIRAMLEVYAAPAAPSVEQQYCDGCDGTGLMEGWNRSDGNSCPKCKGKAVIPAAQEQTLPAENAALRQEVERLKEFLRVAAATIDDEQKIAVQQQQRADAWAETAENYRTFLANTEAEVSRLEAELAQSRQNTTESLMKLVASYVHELKETSQQRHCGKYCSTKDPCDFCRRRYKALDALELQVAQYKAKEQPAAKEERRGE